MSLYCTLADARREIKAQTTTDDDDLLLYIRQTSRRIDQKLSRNRPFFAPSIEQRKFMVLTTQISSLYGTFDFSDPLLEATTFQAGSTTLTNSTHFELLPNSATPYTKARLLNGYDWYQYLSSDTISYITINGVWGYHKDYANAWLSVNLLNGAIASATATTITVDNVDAADAYGITPDISPGSILKVDSEYMEVTATNISTNVATVRRGVLGSTAAAHADDTPVYVWQVHEPIRRAVAKQVGLMYARQASFDNLQATDLAVVQFPSDLMAEVTAILHEMQYT